MYLLILCAAFPAFTWGQVGTSAMPLLRIGQGVRAAALGEAYIALANDASSLYWNPAGLGSVNEFQLAFSHHEWFSDIRDEVGHIAIPAGPGSLGLGVLYSAASGIEGWDENNVRLDDFNTWEAVGTLGYGVRIARTFRLGLSAKGIYQTTHTQAGYGGAADLGLAFRPTSLFAFRSSLFDPLTVGLAARNFGSVCYTDTWEMLPAEVGLGASYSRSGITAVADFVYPMDNQPNFRAGLEYAPVEMLALRLGYRTGPADVSALGFSSGLTAGLGVTLGNLGFDYCFAPYGKLGITHRVGLRMKAERRNPGLVRITVVDMKTMTPLWATVDLSGVIDLKSGTNRRGELMLTNLPSGSLIIRTSHEGYATRTDTLDVIGGREQHATLGLVSLDYGDIWAVLYDSAGKSAIGGTVSYQGPVYGEQQVDPKLGSFALKAIPVGTYVLRAFGPDQSYVPQACTLEVTKGQVAEKQFYLAKRTR